MRTLEKFRLLEKYYLIAVDGSGIIASQKKHCERCLYKTEKKTGKILYYYHSIVDSVLAIEAGMTVPLISDFLENENPRASKQDCEQNAFKRIAAKLKKEFPRLPICITLDALIIGEPLFKLCNDYKWKFIIVLKENLKSVLQEFNELLLFNEKNKKIKTHKDGSREEHSWVNEIIYKTRETKKAPEYSLNVLKTVCYDKNGSKTNTWIWATNIEINRENVNEISKGGRLRWKIENENFNEAKHGGYGLEHQYSTDWETQKCWIIILQLAMMIMNLTYRTTLLAPEVLESIGGIRSLGEELREQIKNSPPLPEEIREWMLKKKRVAFVFG